MKRIDIAEANSPLREYELTVRREPLVVTRRGKPVVAVISLEGVDLESVEVSNNPYFISTIEKSRESIRRSGGISSDEMRRRLGLPAKRQKRTKHAVPAKQS